MTCAGAPQACRKGMIDILGTELRTNCGCEGTAADFRELYDCIGWHRILWVNPCVGKSDFMTFLLVNAFLMVLVEIRKTQSSHIFCDLILILEKNISTFSKISY